MVLLGIHIDRMHMARSCQRIIQGVAARRGDDHNAILRREFECNAVKARVFPALVVDDIPPVNEIEPSFAESFDNHSEVCS